MDIPATLRFSRDHLWVNPGADATLACGITDHAQSTLGDIVFVEPPAVGTLIEAGQSCGVVESVKAASDLHAPVSGEVVEVNQAVLTSPEMLNDSPYQAWIFRVKPTDSRQPDDLMDDEAYRNFLQD